MQTDLYKVSIVDNENQVRISGICTLEELDKYLRNAAKQCATGERCVYRRWGC